MGGVGPLTLAAAQSVLPRPFVIHQVDRNHVCLSPVISSSLNTVLVCGKCLKSIYWVHMGASRRLRLSGRELTEGLGFPAPQH